eukprot:gene3320-3805_t
MAERTCWSSVGVQKTGLLKLLVVVAWSLCASECHVANYLEATICDQSSQYLRCPPAKSIHILQTFYGKWRNHDCHGVLAAKDNIPTCHVDRSKTTAIIRDVCQGTNSCKLYADKTIYGDPCPTDIPKYVYVTYFCLPSHGKSEPKKAATTSLKHIPLSEVRGFIRQAIAKEPDENKDGDEGAVSNLPTTIDDLPGSSDLLFTPLIKILQLASEDMYPPSKWNKVSEADVEGLHNDPTLLSVVCNREWGRQR